MWLDCSILNMSEENLIAFFREKAYMNVNAGSGYGKNCKGFVRVNSACKREELEKCIRMFCEAVIEHQKNI